MRFPPMKRGGTPAQPHAKPQPHAHKRVQCDPPRRRTRPLSGGSRAPREMLVWSHGWGEEDEAQGWGGGATGSKWHTGRRRGNPGAAVRVGDEGGASNRTHWYTSPPFEIYPPPSVVTVPPRGGGGGA